MEIRVDISRLETDDIRNTVENINTEDAEISFKIASDENEQKFIPGIEDRAVEEIVISASYHILKIVYKRIKSYIETEHNSDVQLIASSVEDIKWDIMEDQSGVNRSDLNVISTHTPEESGGSWVYIFEDSSKQTYRLEIHVEDLSVDYEVMN